ncbi:hypothetical protein BDR07DRAFT_1267420, partial [Suillus spraguei]
QWYHRRWQQEDTTDNFFKWLDRGAGKDISLDECPREQLNREVSIRIIYGIRRSSHVSFQHAANSVGRIADCIMCSATDCHRSYLSPQQR